MSEITENYIGYEALVSYLSEQKNWSYRGFLNLNQDIIVTSLFSLTNNSPLTLANWENFDAIWYNRFLTKAKDLFEPITIKKKITTEHLQQRKNLQTFWEVVIKEYKKKYLIPASLSKKTLNQHEHEKENLTSAFLLKEKKEILDQQEENLMPAFTTITSLSKETFKNKKKIVDRNLVPTIIIPKETVNIKLINFCYDILHQLENSPYANLFYKYNEKNIINKVIKYPMDLFTINLKLENNQYTNLEEFEKDIRLIFRNCYTYNDAKSEIYCSGEALESIFNKKWNEKLIFQTRKKGELKRTRDNDTNTNNSSTSKSYIYFLYI
ncbi:hypothetical protein RclHR1_10220001 [Rhizophagus clarus]|uniref:Bromo domain-containing protein n=1 Tax=Rhizophagus clarus TaxID=94130 RepID=A0A2Z6Q194_9GLOM|nr:hypothetical protein RclHR1_10220001 [Rhizophagus clarus]